MKQNKMPKNRPFGAYKKEEYLAFKIWVSIPRMFRGLPETSFLIRSIKDPRVRKIATIQTQKEFAKHFRIRDLGTLTDWRKKIEEEKPDKYLYSPLANTIFQNLVAALYMRGLLYAKPRDIRLFLELIEDWEEPKFEKPPPRPVYDLTDEEKAELDKLLALMRSP